MIDNATNNNTQHLSDGLEPTYKTDVTYQTDAMPTSNADVLRGIFAGLEEPLRPMLLSIEGAPTGHTAWKKTHPPAWHHGAKIATDHPGLNWYFTLAVYHPDGASYRKTEKHCAAIYGVMLDDLGTKALPLDRLAACPPSVVIETSAGNYQALYLFDTPQTDIKRVTALNQSLVDANLCDAGAKSPATRWGRLPFASNGKTDPAFACKLIEWHPARRYSIDAIIAGLELEPPQNERRTQRQRKARAAPDLAAAIDRNAAGVYVPRPDENEVIAALKSRNLYKSPLGGGKHDVTCPWVHEHTDQIDGGAAYFEPDETFPIGGFKCQHSHGDKYRIGALLEFLGVPFHAAKHKPTIKVAPGELHRVVDAGEQVLAETKRYYQRGGLIVSINTSPETRETTIKPVSQPALVRALSGGAVWQRYDGRSDDYVNSDPPARHVQVLFDAEGYNHLPPLAGIARQPHMRPNGSLVREAGYDPQTAMFGVFDARAFSVPAKPTPAQAGNALAELRGLLTEFAFASPHDESAALAGMLTAAIRASLPVAPMFHIKAPQVASGKSYLSNIIAAFAGPGSPSAVAFPTTEEECQKLLLSTLLTAPAVVTFDNLTTDLIPYKSLCSALTEEFLTGRILGVSKTATVGTRSLILSSGNNVDAVKDMARRCVTICLDPQVEIPAARSFKADPYGTVLARRGEFVSLALTIIRAWIEAGSPETPCKTLASYGDWSRWVRQPLLWLGAQDPAARVFEQLAQDPDRETLGRLLTAWRAVLGNAPTMIRAAVAAVDGAFTDDAKNLRECLLEVAEERGEVNRRRLGRWIARHQNRIVDGLRFIRASTTTSAEKWTVETVGTTRPESVMSVMSVTSRPSANVVAVDMEVI